MLSVADTSASCEPFELESLGRVFSALALDLASLTTPLFHSERTRTVGFRLREAADTHSWCATFLHEVAESFRRADSASLEYKARISLVEESIRDWLPTNRDKARAGIVKTARRRLLTFDPAKDGRVVEVFGNAQTATHVAILIPGMDNDITDYPKLRVRAENLEREMSRVAADGETVAVVLWLGYDTPDLTFPRLISEGARSAKAKAGARELVKDVAFLRSVNPNGRLTVIGHSYGSVVLGQAMLLGLDVRDAVALGSPGMGVRNRRDLKSPGVTLWATRHRGRDGIPLLPVHGEDPAAPGFSARRFRSDGVRNHSDYFRSNTAVLTKIARIATGGDPANA